MPNPSALVRRTALLAVLAVAPSALSAQSDTTRARADTVVYEVDPLVVTATRAPRAASTVPQPISVVQRRDMVESLPNTVSELFRDLPGLDVTGVGVNQGRPQIRGQRGQRILLLEDGLRLNNFRRQQDFGELPALVDVNGVQRVEIVRGPASVLYGSDANGGVVNIITRVPEQDGLHGTGSFRYGNVEEQSSGSARVYGRFGAVTLRAGGTLRRAEAYQAPAGTFGNITLDDEATVTNTGVEDRSLDLRLGWEPAGTHAVWGKFETYTADDAGFGSVDPALYAPGSPDIRITYPSQTWSKVTAGWRAQGLDSPLADRIEILAYGQDNDRELDLGFEIPIGPGALLSQTNQNRTDIRTYGARAELRKAASERVLFTYGLDAVRERAQGTDRNTTVITGFGPPMTDVSDRPQLPEARFTTLGAFVQAEVVATDRFTLVGGGRYQWAQAETFRTEGLEQDPVDMSDGTFVAAANAIYELTGAVSLIGSVGRAFRSPNLIERFFDGPTPEGAGYQVRNPDLAAETSLNVDLGVRYVTDRVSLEAFAFRNEITDGVRIRPLGTEIQGLTAFQNVNVDKLLFRGIELGGDVAVVGGLRAGAGYTWLDAKDALNEENPVGESFSSKVTGTVAYRDPADRFWGAWEVRHNGDRKDIELGDNPLGDILPAFTVQNLRGGVTVFRTDGGQVHRLTVAVTNLTNELYAEFSNASFFRPEPKRNVTLSWQVSF
ncbi:MAG: TonB-dependent receptor [Longimicrobiales bacterium]